MAQKILFETFDDFINRRQREKITDKFYDFLFDIIMWIAPRRYKCLFAVILFVVLMLFVVYFLII